MILKDRKSHMPWAIFKPIIDKLSDSAEKLDSEKIRVLLEHIIPTYRPRTFGPQLDERDSVSSRMIKAEA